MISHSKTFLEGILEQQHNLTVNKNVKATNWPATQICSAWSTAVQDCGHNF